MKYIILSTLFIFSCLHVGGQEYVTYDYLKEAAACLAKGDYECAKRYYTLHQGWENVDMSAKIKMAEECYKDLIVAEAYFNDKEYAKARDRYKSVLDKNPKDLHAKKQYDECVRLIVGPASPLPHTETTKTPNVYVAGYEGNAAMLWKNGIGQRLSYRNSPNAEAQSVYVSGNDVYVGGWEEDSRKDRVVKLWKNGIEQNLSDGSGNTYASAQSIYVSGNDMYVVGPKKIYNQNISNTMLWKNGVAEQLSWTEEYYNNASVYVSGNDVYVVGSVYDRHYKWRAKLWKNSVSQKLVDRDYSSSANSVFVSGKDVYVVGSIGSFATIWKNGIEQNLTDEDKSSSFSSVYVANNDIYVAGSSNLNSGGNRVATLWKNDIAQSLSDGKKDVYATSVFVSGNDVYVVGWECYEIGSSKKTPKLWKNGIMQSLATDGIYYDAYDVFVEIP